MEPLKIPHMSLAQIAASGQCFTWHSREGGGYAVQSGGRYLEAKQEGEWFDFSCDRADFEDYWRSYLDLDTDYGAVMARVDLLDTYLSAAVCYGAGMRVLRQELWEVMVCFLISQNNNVKRIQNSVTALCEQYGAVCDKPDGGSYRSFPSPDALAGASAQDFAALGLGYRAKYLEKLAQAMQGDGLAQLRQALDAADDEQATKHLTSLYGIGRKVADCISLYGLHRTDRFPVDTHIAQILQKQYPEGFPYERYRGCLGLIQQYLFYYKLRARGNK